MNTRPGTGRRSSSPRTVARSGAKAVCRAWVALALACGEVAPDAESPPVVLTRSAPALIPDSSGVDAPRMETPAEIASACLRGDPVEGSHWSLEGGTAALLPFARIERLASRDSARLAARLSAAVDALPSDTSVADFRGLPVAVRSAWILVPAVGDSVVVALVARRVPIESAPLEELFAIIAAPGRRQGVRDPLLGGWVSRDVGREEELPARELVGAFLAGDDLALLLAHDASSGSHAEMVVRRDGRWRTAWAGLIPSCGADARSRS
jgi:hypothetical protein